MKMPSKFLWKRGKIKLFSFTKKMLKKLKTLNGHGLYMFVLSNLSVFKFLVNFMELATV